MTNKEFILKLIKYFCFGLILLIVFAVAFSYGFYYRDSGHILQINNNNINSDFTTVRPLDSVLDNPVFHGSVIGVPISIFNGHSFSTVNSTSYMPVIITFSSSSVNFNIPRYSSDGTVGLNSFNYTWSNFSYDTALNDWEDGSIYTNDSIFLGLFVNSGFDFNPIKVNLYSEAGQGIDGKYLTVFEYRDKNDFQLRIHVAFSPSVGSAVSWNLSSRTYFFIDTLTDNQYYDAGVDYGKQLGRDEVWQSRYDTGFSAGRTVGDGEGYIRGVNDANTYTFFNLFGALFDVPVRIVTGLLNFDFLGINLFNFATGILTFIIILKIIGFVKGR